MNTARIVVLTIALIAGGVAAYLASGIGDKPPPTEAITLQTVDVLVAKSDIGLGQTVTAEAVQWQTWPAATASNSFIRRRYRQLGGDPQQRSCSRHRPGAKRKGWPDQRGRQDRNA